LRPGVFTHLYLHKKFQSKYGNTQNDIRSDLREAGFNKEIIQVNVKGLIKLIEGLKWKQESSIWSEYADQNSYRGVDVEAKIRCIPEAVMSQPWNLVWDLGCNVGSFSRIAKENAHYVIAMDADPLVIERFYQDLKLEGNKSILPLVGNLADASPNMGWRVLERKDFPN